MKKARVLLTGGTGLLALNWACAVRHQWDVVLGTHRHRVALQGTSSVALSLQSRGELQTQLEQVSPDLVVHTAGLTNVDQCETDPTMARRANAEIASNIAQAAAVAGIPLIHVSTDHLFAGNHPFYREDDPPHPLNEYGRSKLLAEEWVLQACPRALILRTNFFGWGHADRQSFSDWIISNLRAGKTLSLFDDVYFTPVLADVVALTAHDLIARGASGVFNVVGDDRMSKYAFAVRLAEHFSLPITLLRRDQVGHAKLRASRPHDMSLDNSKTRGAVGKRMPTLENCMGTLRDQERQGRRVELFHAVSPDVAGAS